MKKLTVSKSTFFEMLIKFISSGVTFEAEENDSGEIVVVFTGGF